MSKMRVYELAKELGIDNGAMKKILTREGIPFANHMSSLSQEDVDKVRAILNTGAPAQEQKKDPAEDQKEEPKTASVGESGPDTAKEEKRAHSGEQSAQAPRSPRPAGEHRAAGEGRPARPDRPPRPNGERPKKKKRLIGVFNPNNSAKKGGPDARLVKGHEEQRRRESERRREMEIREQRERTRAGAKRAADLASQEAAKRRALDEERASRLKEQQEREAARQEQQAAEARRAEELRKEKEAAALPQAEPVQTREQKDANRAQAADTEARNTVKDIKPADGARQAAGRDGARERDNNRADGQRPENRGARRDSQDGKGARQSERRSDRRDEGRTDNRGEKRQPRREGQGRPGGSRQDGQRFENRGPRRDGQDTRSGVRQGERRSDGRPDSRGGGNRGGRGGQRGGRLQMPDRPVEAIERQNQKNDRQNQRNVNRRNDRDTDRFDKQAKNARVSSRGLQKPQKAPAKPVKAEETIKTIIIPETLTIKELAEKMKKQPSEIVKKLFMQGKVVTVNQDVDFDTAEEIAMEFDIIAEKEEKVDVIAELLKEEAEAEETMVPRSPVVCVMGHVDHGKTSLLDAIRDSHVTDREAGGITQHIGASVVEHEGRTITFLDTPGHEAFTAMRMRGASSTDIAILVVAADDGVMPQTIEAINHAKAADTEIIVAINKIDKPSANVDKVKQELSEYGLISEDWGGSTTFVPVSAHTKEGIDELLEMILLTADVMELKANPNRQARGVVIEAQLDKGRGPVATVLVQKGTLHVGDFVAAGACSGKVRAMFNSARKPVKEAGPSTPVEILGFNDVPGAGEIFVSPESDKEAKQFASTFVAQDKAKLLEDTKSRMSLDDLFSQIQTGNLKELDLIVKADVQGSVEAVKTSLTKLSNEEVIVKVIHGGVGAITESDVSLASASNAIIIGFNVKPDAVAKATAEREGVDVRLYKVIYTAIEEVEAAMKGMLDPVYEEKVIGHGEVRQTFRASQVGTIAGTYVLDGVFTRNCSVRVTRDGTEIYSGPLASLKRFKDDVKEVRAGYECGLSLEKFNDLQEGDLMEAFAMVEVPR